MFFQSGYKKALREFESNREAVSIDTVLDSEIDNVMSRDFSITERQKWRDLKFYNSSIQELETGYRQRGLSNIGVQLLTYARQRSQQISAELQAIRNHRLDRAHAELDAHMEEYYYATKPYMDILDNFVVQRGIGSYPSRYPDLDDPSLFLDFLHTYERDLEMLFALLAQKSGIACKDPLRLFVILSIKRQSQLLVYQSFKNQIMSHIPAGHIPTIDEILQSFFLYMAQDPSSSAKLIVVVQDILQLETYEAMTLIQDSTAKLQMDMFEQSLSTPSIQVDFDTLSPTAFEQFIAEFLTSTGYVTSLTPVTGDQGADVIAEKGADRWAIQVKHYTGTVGNSAVQEVAAAMAFYKCTRGAVITNSFFTKSAIELANANGVELIDRNTLLSWMNGH